MRTETVKDNGTVTQESLPAISPPEDEPYRKLAIEQLGRVRRFKIRLAGFILAMVIATPVWVVTEYMNADGWPQRLSDNSQPGDWNPWIIWVALIGLFVVGLSGLKAYFDRPTTEAEIRREIERLEGR